MDPQCRRSEKGQDLARRTARTLPRTVITSTVRSGEPRGWAARLVDALTPATGIGWAFAVFEPIAAGRPKKAKARRARSPKLATA